MAQEAKTTKIRAANLRRNRKTVVQNLTHADRVIALWDSEKWEWRLVVESSNGVEISHERLTVPPNLA